VEEDVPGASTAEAVGGVTLADLRPGQRARVVRCHGLEQPLGQRLLHLGLLRGREIEVLRRAPSGDPMEVRVLDSCLSLRRTEARLVEVERCS
jgi:Fe2+ transport system protein FeoA